MTASVYARPSRGAGVSGIAMARGAVSVRYALATGLLLVGLGDLAAIDLVLLPRYVAQSAKAVPPLPAAKSPPMAAFVVPVLAAQPVEQPPTPQSTKPVAAVAPVTPDPPAETSPPAPSAEPRVAPSLPANPEFPHLLFALSTTKLSPPARRILNQLAETLAQDPSRRVVLSGHSDKVGTPDINQALSLNRARRSGRWLVRHGVDPARIETLGFGASHPLDGDGASRIRAHNRRVEIDLR